MYGSVSFFKTDDSFRFYFILFIYSFMFNFFFFFLFFDAKKRCFSLQGSFLFAVTLSKSIYILSGCFRLHLKECHESVMMTEFFGQR